MYRCFVMAILLVLTLKSTAQKCAGVTGKVYDVQTGEPLMGASVRFIGSVQTGTTTDATGSFEIIPANAGDTLFITYIGYKDHRVTAEQLTNCTVKILLEPMTKNIQSIEIKAERIIAEEFTIRKIKKLEIYTNPSAKADPILAVNSTPSATTLDESANISLRGGSPAETGIFLNNVPINDAVRYSQLNGIGTFSIFNTALVNNVQVYPGNPPLEYGNSTSGIIALQTDENLPERPSHTVSLTLASAGIYSSRRISKNSSLTFFSNCQPSLFLRSLNTRSLRDLKSFSSIDLGLHYFGKIGSNAAVKIFNYSVRESYEFRYEQPTYSGIFDQHKVRNFTVANVRKRLGKTEISYNQGVSFSRATYGYGTTDIDLRLQDFFSSFNIHSMGISHAWKTGISYDHKASDFSGTFPAFEFAAGEEHPVISAESKDHIHNPEWFGYYKRYVGSKWIAGVGARKNIAVKKLVSYWSVQGNLNFKPKENWNFTASAGRYHKYQLPQGESNSPVLLESDQYSLDLGYTALKTESSISLFYKESKALQEKTFLKGIEIFTRYKLNSNLRCQVSLTSLEAIKESDDEKLPSPYDIHYFIRGNIEYKFVGTWTATCVFLFRQGSYFYPVTEAMFISFLNAFEPTYSDNPKRLPGYNTIDVSISKIFPLTERSTAIAFASAGNIGNFKNVRAYSYNFDYTSRKEYLFSQRTLYFGMIINF